MDEKTIRESRELKGKSNQAELDSFRLTRQEVKPPEWLTADGVEGQFHQIQQRIERLTGIDISTWKSFESVQLLNRHEVAKHQDGFESLQLTIEIYRDSFQAGWYSRFIDDSRYDQVDAAKLTGPHSRFDDERNLARDFYYREAISLGWIQSAIQQGDEDWLRELELELHRFAHTIDVFEETLVTADE
jgi:hypothetical protein